MELTDREKKIAENICKRDYSKIPLFIIYALMLYFLIMALIPYVDYFAFGEGEISFSNEALMQDNIRFFVFWTVFLFLIHYLEIRGIIKKLHKQQLEKVENSSE